MPSKSAKKWLLLAAKIFVVLLIAWGVRRTLLSAIEELRDPDRTFQWRLQPAWLALSGLLYLLALLPSGLFWKRVLTCLEQPTGTYRVLRAYFIGHLGKYVPGKALVVILRTSMVSTGGTATAVVAASVFYETLTMMAVGASVAAAILAFVFHEKHLFLMQLAAALAVAAAVPVLPPVFKRLARLAGVGRKYPQQTEQLGRLGMGTFAWGWSTIAVGWVLMGLSLWACLRGLDLIDSPPYHRLEFYTASVSLAVVAGFLSLIPGGAGVRELVFLQLLAPGLGDEGPAKALVAAVVVRLVWLVSEVAVSGILYLLPPRSPAAAEGE